jgi:hypothetical protein
LVLELEVTPSAHKNVIGAMPVIFEIAMDPVLNPHVV